jgi:hypothetical protein
VNGAMQALMIQLGSSLGIRAPVHSLSSIVRRLQNPDSSHHSFDEPLTTISDILIRFIRTSKKMHVRRGPALSEVEIGHRPQPR